MEARAKQKLDTTWLILKITYGLACIAVGIDKFTNVIAPWEQYVSQLVLNVNPLPVMHLMWVIGIIEIAVGILILSPLTRIGAYLVMAWLLVVVLNLFVLGQYYDIIARDLVMAAGAFALAQLSELRCECG